MNTKEYFYGMRLRGFSIGAQPTKGLIRREDSTSDRYHDILVYDRKLTEKEIADYELDYLKGDKNFPLNWQEIKNSAKKYAEIKQKIFMGGGDSDE